MVPENFVPIRPTVQKLRHFFKVTDGRTDGRTKTNHPCTIGKIFFFFFFCIYVRGKEGNSTNPTKFLPLHFVKLAALASLVKDNYEKMGAIENCHFLN